MQDEQPPPGRQPDYGDSERPGEELVGSRREPDPQAPSGLPEAPEDSDAPEDPAPMAPAEDDLEGEPLTDPHGPSG